MQKRVLGWIWGGTMGGLALAGLLLLVIPGWQAATGRLSSVMLGIGGVGMLLQALWSRWERKRERMRERKRMR